MDEVFKVALSGEFSLRNIAELSSRLRDALAENQNIAIDTGAVEGVDVATLQLLVAAQKSAVATGRTMLLTAAPETPVGRALVAAGLVAADGTPLVPEAATWSVRAAA